MPSHSKSLKKLMVAILSQKTTIYAEDSPDTRRYKQGDTEEL
jgi:hypothetical protein